VGGRRCAALPARPWFERSAAYGLQQDVELQRLHHLLPPLLELIAHGEQLLRLEVELHAPHGGEGAGRCGCGVGAGCGAAQRCRVGATLPGSARGGGAAERVCRVQGEDGRGEGLRRTHRFVLPRRICGGSGIMRECRTSSTAFCTQFRTTSWSFCASVRPSPLEEEVGLGTREPDEPNMRSRLLYSPLEGWRPRTPLTQPGAGAVVGTSAGGR
jgi:hypothetical protein